MRAGLIILALAPLASPVAAFTLPAGYVPATIVGTAPEGSRAMQGYAKRRDCGRSITVLVERDSRLLPASGRIVCSR